MRVLLSIKPEYSKKIFSGEKKYEFRKRRPKFVIDLVFVYESSPTRNIVGWFSVKGIHSGSPEEIWETCKDSSGIERNNYFEYCNGTDIIYAFEIDEAFKFKNPMNPFEMFSDFKPPQSFCYLNGSIISETIENNRMMLAIQRSSIFDSPMSKANELYEKVAQDEVQAFER
jgi:predicted transcriptional regulator